MGQRHSQEVFGYRRFFRLGDSASFGQCRPLSPGFPSADAPALVLFLPVAVFQAKKAFCLLLFDLRDLAQRSKATMARNLFFGG
mmetsp:Transcript_102452/g.256715  ORF Transcript_102452/g.256715 Transcript_102452/m.256715 type:complete len:84 (-) Transcript_102452:471-722(-)